MQDRFRPAAAARMTARLGSNGQILGWLAKVAAPHTGQELAGRTLANDLRGRVTLGAARGGDPYAVAGAVPPL